MYICVCVYMCVLLTVMYVLCVPLNVALPDPSKVGKTTNRTAGTPHLLGPGQGVDTETT